MPTRVVLSAFSEELLRRMGLALDEAKRQGGDKVVEDTESQEV